MESRKSSRKPAPTCPSKCLQVYSWNCCLAGMPRKFEETPDNSILDWVLHRMHNLCESGAQMSYKMSRCAISVALLVIASFTNTSFGQAVSGNIIGTVTDP